MSHDGHGSAFNSLAGSRAASPFRGMGMEALGSREKERPLDVKYGARIILRGVSHCPGGVEGSSRICGVGLSGKDQ
jgi:hypothetical protein